MPIHTESERKKKGLKRAKSGKIVKDKKRKSKKGSGHNSGTVFE